MPEFVGFACLQNSWDGKLSREIATAETLIREKCCDSIASSNDIFGLVYQWPACIKVLFVLGGVWVTLVFAAARMPELQLYLNVICFRR